MATQPGYRSAPLPLVLASASPRRRQLLRQAGLAFRVLPSRFREGPPAGPPAVFARRAAQAKAAETSRRLKTPAWVLAADTLVVCGGEVFGKPRGRAVARRMLSRLAGRTHLVLTGVALRRAPRGPSLTWVERTRVRLRALSPAELRAYLDSGEWRGKAGGYGIQGRAGAFVTSVRGCYCNVVGLPLGAVCGRLARLGLVPGAKP